MKNLPKRFTVRVNKTNIRRGVRFDGGLCAVAKAVRREIQAKRRNVEVNVSPEGVITVFTNGTEVNYKCLKTQQRIADFIKNFDKSKRLVKPTKFRVRAV